MNDTELQDLVAELIAGIPNHDLAAKIVIRTVATELGRRGGRPRRATDKPVTQNAQRFLTECKPVTHEDPPRDILSDQDLDLDQDQRSKISEAEGSSEPDFVETGLPPEEPVEVLLTFPVVGSAKTWALTVAFVAKCHDAYPALDVMGEFGRARLWLEANPARRKTARGMPAFLQRWLDRAQNSRGGGAHAPPGSRPPRDPRVGHARIEEGTVYPDGEQDL